MSDFIEKVNDAFWANDELFGPFNDLDEDDKAAVIRFILRHAEEHLSLMLGGPHSSSIFSVEDVLRCMERLRDG